MGQYVKTPISSDEHPGRGLTPLRAQILDLIKNAGRPIRAYELLDALAVSRGHAAPPTVYRALHYLIDRGLVHRVESLNAFAICQCESEGKNPSLEHIFFVCRACGSAEEVVAEDAARTLRSLCAMVGFRPNAATLEVQGSCKNCLSVAEQANASVSHARLPN